MQKNVFIAGLCRTAVGSFGGSFKDIKAVELGNVVIAEALRRAGISPADVDEVFMGNVLQAGLGQNPARQAAIAAGIPDVVPAVTINKVCGSGLYSVALAYRSILSGENECAIAGGMESMSSAPYIAEGMRWGFKMGNTVMKDVMINDGLWDAFNNYHMGITAENVAERYGITREIQDELAAASQQKAQAARDSGRFDDEIVPVMVSQHKNEPIQVNRDEYIRDNVTVESITRLKPAFKKDGGTVTAANASGINDGAAAMVVCSESFARSHGVTPMLKILSSASVGVAPSVMGLGPIESVKKALKKSGLSISDIDLFEINEAFAAQAYAVCSELGIDMKKVNVNGGAIAIGHPIGASGARILVTLAYEMKKRNARYGVASLCIGGGMGEAMVVELIQEVNDEYNFVPRGR